MSLDGWLACQARRRAEESKHSFVPMTLEEGVRRDILGEVSLQHQISLVLDSKLRDPLCSMHF